MKKYVKLSDDSFIYPYTLEDFKRDNPNVTIGLNLSDYGLFEPYPTPKPTSSEFKYEETVEFVNSKWVIKWIPIQKTLEEINKDISKQMQDLKVNIKGLLRDCDWRMLSDYPYKDQAEWKKYREDLRALLNSTDPSSVILPTKPQNDNP